MKPLPPLPKEAFDGEQYTIELTQGKCCHKNLSYRDGELTCTCGAAWHGPNIERLYNLLKNSAT